MSGLGDETVHLRQGHSEASGFSMALGLGIYKRSSSSLRKTREEISISSPRGTFD